jgi:hypothetical protein
MSRSNILMPAFQELEDPEQGFCTGITSVSTEWEVGLPTFVPAPIGAGSTLARNLPSPVQAPSLLAPEVGAFRAAKLSGLALTVRLCARR